MNEKTETAIVEYSPTAAALADIASRMAKVVYDVSTPAGMAAAKKDRAEVRDLRVALEKKRKEIKEPALKRCNEIDTEAKRITAELLKYETPPDEAIKAEERRIEDERLAKVAREQARQADIERRIANMRNTVNSALRAKTSDEVVRILADVQGVVIDPELYAEFKDTATLAKNESVAELERIRDEFVVRETEAERLQKERAEFERQKAEQAAADKARAEREEDERRRKADIQERISELRGNQNLTASSGTKLIAEHLADLNKLPVTQEIFGEYFSQALDAQRIGVLRLSNLYQSAKDHEAEQDRQRQQRAENERIAAEQAAAQKVIDDQRRALEAQQQAQRDADAARERAEQQARDEAARLEREAAEAREREAQAERERNFRPSFEELVDIIGDHYGRDEETVRGWLINAIGEQRAAA
jgi:hypothetical protein